LLKEARLGWVVVGLAVLVSACAAPGEGLQSPGTGAKPSIAGETQSMTPTVTKVVAAVEATPTQDVATEAPTAVVEVTAAEGLPAAIEAAEATVAPTPTEVEMAATEMPAATVAVTPTEAEMVPTETPTLKAEATPEDAAQGQANTDPGPSEEQLQLLASLNNYGPAPQWHNDVWLNSEPLTLADLRGKVVMVEFWTFG
jgi:hypothetical protein